MTHSDFLNTPRVIAIGFIVYRHDIVHKQIGTKTPLTHHVHSDRVLQISMEQLKDADEFGNPLDFLLRC